MRLLLAAALVCAASASATSTDVSRAFCAATVDGNFDAVKKYIRDGVDVDHQCLTIWGTFSALYIASQLGHTEVVRWLLKAGADANTVDHQGASPLYIAAQQNHDDLVRLLLAEVDPRQSIKKPGGFSCLHIAAQQGHNIVVKILLDDGRLPTDGISDEGLTPLFFAAQFGHRDTAKILLSHGADARGVGRLSPTTYKVVTAAISFVSWTALVGVVLGEVLQYKFSPSHTDPGVIASQRGHHELAALLAKHELEAKAKWLGFCFMIVGLTRVVAYLYNLYLERQKKLADRRAIRDRAMRRAQPTTEPADETKAEPDLTPVEPRASPEPAERQNTKTPTVRRRKRRDGEAAAARAARNEAALARARDAREVREARDRERRDAAAAALAREREARERDAAAARAREEREREAAALEAARERDAAEREAAARAREQEAARAAAAASETKSEEPLGREESKSEPPPEGYEIVARVLEHLGEPHLLSTFEAQQIDDDALPFLEPSDLLDLGVAPMTVLAILGAAAAGGKEKKLEAEDILHDVATHQSAIEEELREHRAEIERLKIQRREVPDEYCCPITCELMKEPVLCVEDGQTYERCAVERWWSRSEAKTSPSTGATLASTTLAPNYALKSLIAGWKAQRSRARD